MRLVSYYVANIAPANAGTIGRQGSSCLLVGDDTVVRTLRCFDYKQTVAVTHTWGSYAREKNLFVEDGDQKYTSTQSFKHFTSE